jgi:hypothetical protein
LCALFSEKQAAKEKISAQGLVAAEFSIFDTLPGIQKSNNGIFHTLLSLVFPIRKSHSETIIAL